MRATILLSAAFAACAPEVPDANSAAPETEAFGPERQIYGRVHDVADHNRGLPGTVVSTDRDEMSSDIFGGFRLAASTADTLLFVQADNTGWTPHVVHVHAATEDTEIWPGLMQLEDADRALSIVAGTSSVSPSFLSQSAYLVVQPRMPNRSSLVNTEHAEVRVFDPRGAPLMDAYQMQYNDALSTCLPVRGEDGVARGLPDCEGITMFPEVPVGVPLEVEVEMFDGRTCARSYLQAIAGETEAVVRFSITAERGYLNVVRLECVNPELTEPE